MSAINLPPSCSLTAADLLAVIGSGFPAPRLHPGHRFVGLTNKTDAVEACFENGSRITADVLVGADGMQTVHCPAWAKPGKSAETVVPAICHRGPCPANASSTPAPRHAAGHVG